MISRRAVVALVSLGLFTAAGFGSGQPLTFAAEAEARLLSITFPDNDGNVFDGAEFDVDGTVFPTRTSDVTDPKTKKVTKGKDIVDRVRILLIYQAVRNADPKNNSTPYLIQSRKVGIHSPPPMYEGQFEGAMTAKQKGGFVNGYHLIAKGLLGTKFVAGYIDEVSLNFVVDPQKNKPGN